jgi:hypothetical protein
MVRKVYMGVRLSIDVLGMFSCQLDERVVLWETKATSSCLFQPAFQGQSALRYALHDISHPKDCATLQYHAWLEMPSTYFRCPAHVPDDEAHARAIVEWSTIG